MTEREWRAEFSKRLRCRLNELNMTQTDLARVTGLTEVSIHRYIYCERTPKSYDMLKIAKAVKCTVSELIEFDGKEETDV